MLETYFFGRIFAAEIYYYSFRYFFVCVKFPLEI